MSNKLIFSVLFSLKSLLIIAQPISNTEPYRNINSAKYFRFYYDNDFFTATDQYYSQGINLELVHPMLGKLSGLLIRNESKLIKYGMAVEHLAYTPTSIRHLEIINGDRPFAGSLSLKSFAITCDTVKHWRLTSTLYTGVIGPAAGGEWMQKTIHRILNNIEPLGWNNQIQNDVIINYDLAYEKLFLSHKQLFSLSSYSQIAAGTLHDKINAGLILMFGHFNNPFINRKDESGKKTFQMLFYNKPSVNFVWYDATLQGGLFNHDSPYKIAAINLSRITYEDESGITVQYKNIYLEYFQHFITKEFTTGNYHRWGGLRAGASF